MEKAKIIGLVNAAHGNAIAKGWWEQDRTLPELVALIHSEASEALEDFRNGHKPTKVLYEYKEKDVRGKIDDDFSVIGVGPGGLILSIQPSVKDGENVILGKPCGIPSELADIVIRVYDLVGKNGVVDDFSEILSSYLDGTITTARIVRKEESFGDNMGWLHAIISGILTGGQLYFEAARVVRSTYELAESCGIDLDAIIAEKMAYNTRREYRHGGKVL